MRQKVLKQLDLLVRQKVVVLLSQTIFDKYWRWCVQSTQTE